MASRQRLLRSFGNVAGDTTLWGQEFTGQINNKGRTSADGTITAWLAQARYMFTAHTSGKRIVIGSSMGGWLALLLLHELLERVGLERHRPGNDPRPAPGVPLHRGAVRVGRPDVGDVAHAE